MKRLPELLLCSLIFILVLVVVGWNNSGQVEAAYDSCYAASVCGSGSKVFCNGPCDVTWCVNNNCSCEAHLYKYYDGVASGGNCNSTCGDQSWVCGDAHCNTCDHCRLPGGTDIKTCDCPPAEGTCCKTICSGPTPTNPPPNPPTPTGGSADAPSCSISPGGDICVNVYKNFTGSCSDVNGDLDRIVHHFSPTNAGFSGSWTEIGRCTTASGEIGGGGGSCIRGRVWDAVGQYYIIANGADTSGLWCSANPWCNGWPPTRTDEGACNYAGLSWCGSGDVSVLNVEGAPTTAPIPQSLSVACTSSMANVTLRWVNGFNYDAVDVQLYNITLGANAGWWGSQTGSSVSVNLSPGSYRFHVRGKHCGDGPWSAWQNFTVYACPTPAPTMPPPTSPPTPTSPPSCSAPVMAVNSVCDANDLEDIRWTWTRPPDVTRPNYRWQINDSPDMTNPLWDFTTPNEITVTNDKASNTQYCGRVRVVRTDSACAVPGPWSAVVCENTTCVPTAYCEVSWFPASQNNMFPGMTLFNARATVSNVVGMTTDRVEFTPDARWPGDPVPVSVNPLVDDSSSDGRYYTSITMNTQVDGVVTADVYNSSDPFPICTADIYVNAGNVCMGASVSGLAWCPVYPSATFNALFEWPDVGGGVTHYQAFLGTCNNWTCPNLLPINSGAPDYRNYQNWNNRTVWDCLDDDNNDGTNECGVVVGGLSVANIYYFSVRTIDGTNPLACSPASNWSAFAAVNLTCAGPTPTIAPTVSIGPSIVLPSPTPIVVDGFVMTGNSNDLGGYCEPAGGNSLVVEDGTEVVGMNPYDFENVSGGLFNNVDVGDGSGVLQLNVPVAWGYQCACNDDPSDPQTCLYNINISSGDPTGYIFFVEETPAAPWWQTSGGGDVGANVGGIRSDLPDALQFLLDQIGGDPGVVTYKSGGINYGLGNISNTDWQAQSDYDEGTGANDIEEREDFDYFVQLIGVVPGVTDTLGSPGDAQKPASGTYYQESSVTINDAWSVSGEEITIFVDGDLNIGNDITVTNGGFLAFIVNGDINIASGVSQVQGIYIADETITVSGTGAGDDIAFTGEGTFVGWNADGSGVGISLKRDLAGTSDSTDPAERFNYRPDLLLNAPDAFRDATFTWQEVAP